MTKYGKSRIHKTATLLSALLIAVSLGMFAGCESSTDAFRYISPEDIPAYSGELFVEIDGGDPSFTDEELEDAEDSYKEFGKLDKMDRCTGAEASLSLEEMPDQTVEERADISEIHPSGWHSGMDWERMHLIAWSLSGENANEENLITGTHDCNYNAMRPFEIETAEYLERNPDAHVLYRVIPDFEEDELVARGVQMEAESVEDDGEGLSFNVYCYNVRRDGAAIDYDTGLVDFENARNSGREEGKTEYVLNTGSMKFHRPECSGAEDIAEWNREEVLAKRQDLVEEGYDPCGLCKP